MNSDFKKEIRVYLSQWVMLVDKEWVSIDRHSINADSKPPYTFLDYSMLEKLIETELKDLENPTKEELTERLKEVSESKVSFSLKDFEVTIKHNYLSIEVKLVFIGDHENLLTKEISNIYGAEILISKSKDKHFLILLENRESSCKVKLISKEVYEGLLGSDL